MEQTSPDLIFADNRLKGFFQNYQGHVIYTDEVEEWIGTDITYPKNDKNVPFYIGFTSGSTGKPKAFVRSHTSWVESFRCNQVDLGMTGIEHVVISGSFVNSTFLYGALTRYF